MPDTLTAATADPVFTPVTTATAHIEFRALDPIHHGGGTAGNTAVIRTQDVVDPDGTLLSVPFVSGSSLVHQIREALAWLVVSACEIPDGSLPRGAVDLLWSGGALTESGQHDLSALRERHQLLPGLALLGYAFKNDLTRSTLFASHVHLVCEENLWRLPDRYRRDPAALKPAAALIGEDFGTRHDQADGPAGRLIDAAMFGETASAQMIFSQQVILPGTLWHTLLGVDAATPSEVDALGAALHHITTGRGWRLGGKSARGYGRVEVVSDTLAGIVPDPAGSHARYVAHLAAVAADVRRILT